MVIDPCKQALPLLSQELPHLGIELSHAQRARYVEYCRLLEDVGRHTNVTGIRDPALVMTVLFLDSLSLLEVIDPLVGDQPAVRLADVGSGAGIPGLPLAIARPGWSVSLVESIGKKTNFMSKVVERLELEHVSVVQGRAEDLGHDAAFRDSHDVAIARAVASLATLVEFCSPLVRPGGWIVLPKSGGIDAEVEDAEPARRSLELGPPRVARLTPLAPLRPGRVAVVYEKLARTPLNFPRRVGEPKARPLSRKPGGERGAASRGGPGRQR